MEKNRVSKFAHYEAQLKSIMVRKTQDSASLLPGRTKTPGWKSFRAAYTRKQPSFKVYDDISRFKGSSPSSFRSSTRSLSFSSYRSANLNYSSRCLISQKASHATLEECIGLDSLRRAYGIVRSFSEKDWGAVTPVYEQEMIKLCKLINNKFGG